jgi:hypothetical protein
LALSLFRGLSPSDDTLPLVNISPASLLRRVFNSAKLSFLTIYARNTVNSYLIVSSERFLINLINSRILNKVSESFSFSIARVTRFGGISQALRNMPVSKFEDFIRL